MCLGLFNFDLYISCDQTILIITVSMLTVHLTKHLSVSIQLRLDVSSYTSFDCHYACRPDVWSDRVVMHVVLCHSPCHLTEYSA